MAVAGECAHTDDACVASVSWGTESIVPLVTTLARSVVVFRQYAESGVVHKLVRDVYVLRLL